MMRNGLVVLGLVVALAACNKETPAEKASDDARDIAMVEKMSREPFKPIVPVGITQVDITRYGLDKPGCSFREGGQKDPLFIGTPEEGFMRVGPDLKRFSARKLSADLPSGARTTYIGLSSWVDIVRHPDGGTDADGKRWPARLIVHDSQERVAFRADGEMTCRESGDDLPSVEGVTPTPPATPSD